MKKILPLSLSLLFVLSGCSFNTPNISKISNKTTPADKSSLSQTTGNISPTEAYKLCNKQSCLSKEVAVEGKLQQSGINFYTISDGNESVYIRLNNGISIIDRIKLGEQLLTLKGGIVQAVVRGTMAFNEWGMCNDSGCSKLVELNVVYPTDFQFVSILYCPNPQIDSGGVPGLFFAPGDCFTLKIGGKSLSDAYQILTESKIYRDEGYDLTGLIDYSGDYKAYAFQASKNSQPGGCSAYYYVAETKLIFNQSCADIKNNLHKEEEL